jgi:hypothetical protein
MPPITLIMTASRESNMLSQVLQNEAVEYENNLNEPEPI